MGVTNKLIKMIVNCRNKVKFKLRIPSSYYDSVQNAFSILPLEEEEEKEEEEENKVSRFTFAHIHTYSLILSMPYEYRSTIRLYFLF